MSGRSPIQRFTSELKRRHVPETAAIYLVAAWAAIEFADVIVPNLNGPQWAITAVIVAAGVGLPVVLVLAWLYDWGQEGVHRTGPEETDPDPDRDPDSMVRPPSTPWIPALAVLVVGIGSALVVAALVSAGDDQETANVDTAADDGEPSERDPGRDLLVPPGFAGDRRLLEVDTTDLDDLVDLARTVAAEAGLSILIQEPAAWRVGRSVPAPLTEGETLVIEGLARDTAGVESVSVDGETVARSDPPEEVLRFTGRITGTGTPVMREVPIVVRTRDGREIRTEYRVAQRPRSGAPDGP